MTIETIIVLLVGSGIIAFFAWFFFGKKEGKRAAAKDGVQEITVRVEGTYQPDRIQVIGPPLREHGKSLRDGHNNFSPPAIRA